MSLVLTGLLLVIDVGLLVVAVRRPWAALVGLLAGLPFNGFLTRVVGQTLGLDSTGELALAGWHDAIVLGIALSALLVLVRSRPWRLTAIEWLVAAVCVVGVVYVVVSPVTLTALYAYRTIYEPPVLLASLLVLGRLGGVPDWLPGRAAFAMIVAGVSAALYAWPQVYLWRFGYLQTYYTEPGAQIHHSFLATGITQPRGIGTFSSPNEFGAYLAIAMTLLLVPGLVRTPGYRRTLALCIMGLALLLTFSRSGWLSLAVAVVVVGWVGRHSLPGPAAIAIRLRAWRGVWLHAGMLGSSAVLAVVILASSGGTTLIQKTATGTDPSAANRPASIERGVNVVRQNPLGLGLGTAGPKAARFGEKATETRILTEAWYVVYAIQVGLGGALLFGLLILAALIRLWAARRTPWAVAALGVGSGLAVGALFIPIVEDPAVATPLWTIVGLGIALAAQGRPAGEGASDGVPGVNPAIAR